MVKSLKEEKYAQKIELTKQIQKVQKENNLKKEQSFMDVCRSQEAGKPLFVQYDTLVCCLSGCIVCAYKITVQPKLPYQTSFRNNMRPEECLRAKYFQQNQQFKYFKKDQAQTILILGDGNLTFAESLCLLHPNSKIIATTYLSKQELHEAYGKEQIIKTIENILKSNSPYNKVYHNVDATCLQNNEQLIKELTNLQIDRVYFNFPCVPGQNKSQDGQLQEIEDNKKMIENIFQSLQAFSNQIAKIKEIRIAHKCKGAFRSWSLPDRTAKSNFKLSHTEIFDRELYPLYQNRKVGSKSGFPITDAKVYIFRKEDLEGEYKKQQITSDQDLLDMKLQKKASCKLEEQLQEKKVIEMKVQTYGMNLVVCDKKLLESICELLICK